MSVTKGDDKVPSIRVFLGLYVHSISKEQPLVICPNGVIGVKDGRILFVDVETNLAELKERHSFTSDDIYVIGQGQFLMPGLVDTHIHAPQYPNAGLGLDLPLMEWLEKYKFPMEIRFHDLDFADTAYREVVNGTTTASYFATSHRQASELLADIAEEYGQRAFIGKLCDDTYCPETYQETTEACLKSTEEFVVYVLKKTSTRVKPTISPGFALGCSEELMCGLAEIAKKYDVNIQTHLCESEVEIQKTLELLPQYETCTEIFKNAGLLTNKAIMAHCVHMKESEIELLRRHSTGIAHCPTSNICLMSGLCPVRKYMDAGVNVGLGTDVSGGYSPSILESMRHAILTSKTIKMQDSAYVPLTFREAFFLGTLGGAGALALAAQIGNFEVGKSFDALHVDLGAPGSAVHIFPGQTSDQMIEKFVMLGDDRNLVQVFVEGRKVKGNVVSRLLDPPCVMGSQMGSKSAAVRLG